MKGSELDVCLGFLQHWVQGVEVLDDSILSDNCASLNNIDATFATCDG